jgi:hypothetical protein
MLPLVETGEDDDEEDVDDEEGEEEYEDCKDGNETDKEETDGDVQGDVPTQSLVEPSVAEPTVQLCRST